MPTPKPTPQDIYGIAFLFTEKEYRGEMMIVVDRHPKLPKTFNDEVESAVLIGGFEFCRDSDYGASAGVFPEGGYPNLSEQGIPHDAGSGLSSLRVPDDAKPLKLGG